MTLLSIVSPIYHTGSMVNGLVEKLQSVLNSITDNYEIILIDDGSRDNSWMAILEACEMNARIKGLKLSRNFGQHPAITAGLDKAQGQWVVVMDSDLQDLPDEIPRLFETAIAGYDIVLARRKTRNDSLMRKMYSRSFYFILSRLSGMHTDASIANFGIYSAAVVRQICLMRENARFFPMMVNWVGFKKAFIDVDHGAREAGRSGYTLRSLLNLALNITLTYSDKPLRYVVKAGFLISLLTVIYGAYILIRYFSGAIIVLGYTSLLLSIWFLGGLILFTLGMVGLYVGKTFEGIKQRPLYIIEKTIN